MKSFTYTNDIGATKTLRVFDKENGKFPVELWCLDNGEYCGSGNFSREELNNYLEHYKIEGRM